MSIHYFRIFATFARAETNPDQPPEYLVPVDSSGNADDSGAGSQCFDIVVGFNSNLLTAANRAPEIMRASGGGSVEELREEDQVVDRQTTSGKVARGNWRQVNKNKAIDRDGARSIVVDFWCYHAPDDLWNKVESAYSVSVSMPAKDGVCKHYDRFRVPVLVLDVEERCVGWVLGLERVCCHGKKTETSTRIRTLDYPPELDGSGFSRTGKLILSVSTTSGFPVSMNCSMGLVFFIGDISPGLELTRFGLPELSPMCNILVMENANYGSESAPEVSADTPVVGPLKTFSILTSLSRYEPAFTVGILTTDYPFFDRWYNIFLANSAYKVGEALYRLATALTQPSRQYHTACASATMHIRVLLHTGFEPFRPSSSLNHFDSDFYRGTEEFLARPQQVSGRTDLDDEVDPFVDAVGSSLQPVDPATVFPVGIVTRMYLATMGWDANLKPNLSSIPPALVQPAAG
ncbi:hypothetical protein BJ742DRAFT_769096 [Cladochytrium replicatum]|nr:hypothetical protein BJ742DRAFT_769096 [Cladochytrium replicatum]